MGTQLNALPALPVRARTVSGCLNSALLGLERNRPAVVTSQLPGEPASALLCSCFATESLAQTAPLSRATNLHIKANRVPPCGFVQEPVPERPQTLAVKPSSAQGPSGTGFFLERNRFAVGKTKAPLVAGGPQQLTPAAPYSPLLERNRSTVVTSQLFGEPASALLCSRLASPVTCPNHPSCP